MVKTAKDKKTHQIPLNDLLAFNRPKTEHLQGYPPNWSIINDTITIFPVCEICNTILTMNIKDHLKTHNTNLREYLDEYPNAEITKRAVSHCRICNSQKRFTIDAQILNLYPIEKIEEYVDFTAEEIKEHANHVLSFRLVKHFNLARAVVDGTDNSVKEYSMHALNRLIAQIEDSQVLKNVKPKDVIEALKLINEINKDDKPIKLEGEFEHKFSIKDILKKIKEEEKIEEEGNENGRE